MDHFPGENGPFPGENGPFFREKWTIFPGENGPFSRTIFPDHSSGGALSAHGGQEPRLDRSPDATGQALGPSQDSGQRDQSWETGTRSESKFLNWVSSI